MSFISCVARKRHYIAADMIFQSPFFIINNWMQQAATIHMRLVQQVNGGSNDRTNETRKTDCLG